jgi:hypothetical protein
MQYLRDMLYRALCLLGHCRQPSRYTWPVGSGYRHRGPAYVVCLDCGSEFLYDATNWRVVS